MGVLWESGPLYIGLYVAFMVQKQTQDTVLRVKRKDVMLPVRMTSSQRARLDWLAQRRGGISVAQVVREATDILYEIEQQRKRDGKPPYPFKQQF